MNNDLRDLYSCKDYENMMYKVESNYVLCGSKIIPTETTYHFVDLDKNQKVETKYSFIKNLKVRFVNFIKQFLPNKKEATAKYIEEPGIVIAPIGSAMATYIQNEYKSYDEFNGKRSVIR